MAHRDGMYVNNSQPCSRVDMLVKCDVAPSGSEFMPTVMRIGRYRFFFYSNESQEPPHIHVKAGGEEVKFWLEPIALAANHGFNGRELKVLERLVNANQVALLEAWNEHLGE